MPTTPPQTTTFAGTKQSALDFIKSAMRMNNALASGETPTASEAQDGVAILNQMLDAWNAEGLMMFTVLMQDFGFIPEQQVYTLGTGGDFDTLRPAKIDRASVVLISNPVSPLEIPITIYNDQSWQLVTLKRTDTTFPTLVYDDGAYPLRNLSFWPVPREQTSKFRFYSRSPLSQFKDLSTPLTFPPAYYEAIRYNLAIRLAPEFPGAPLRPEIAVLAQQAIAKIKAMNAKDDVLTSDLSSLSSW